jgi:diaminopimelate decarboxylase
MNGMGSGSVASQIGVRVNPQVGAGTMEGYSTGTLTSKFGIGLRDDPEQLLRAFQRHSWLRTIMCHVGSQVRTPLPLV